MMTRAELVALDRSLRDREVLSAYVDADQHDPAARDAWMTVLEGEAARIRRELEDGDGPFQAAWAHLRDALRSEEGGFFRGRGLVAFATSDGVAHLEHLPISTRTLVRWDRGARLAPYVRVLKQSRPVAVALVDRERLNLYTFQDSALEEDLTLVLTAELGDLSDVGMAHVGSRGSGRRGETSTDQAQRILDHEMTRRLREAARELEERVAEGGGLIIGGTPEAVARLRDALPPRVLQRSVSDESLHLDMSASELRNAVRALASQATAAEHTRLVEQVLDAARSGGRGAMGIDQARRALAEGRVDALLLSRTLLWSDPDLAEELVRAAFDQGADVLEIGGPAADALQAEAGGVAARLRYGGPSGATAEATSPAAAAGSSGE